MKTNKTAVIAGASGQIGNELIQFLLNSSMYSKVIALVRKPLNINDSKLIQIHIDFSNIQLDTYPIDDVFCCLGTTIKKAGNKEVFREIDLQYPINLANTSLALGATRYFLVSAAGANSTSSIFYSQVKGELEDAIKKMAFDSIFIFRPSMLLGKRNEFRFGEILGKFIMKSISFIIPTAYKAIESKQVAYCMLRCAESDAKGIQLNTNKMMLEVV